MKKSFFLAALVVIFSGLAHAAKKDACMETPPSYVTAVLVDVSTPLDQPSALAFGTLVDKIIASSPNHSRVDVYKIADGSTGLDEPIISKCKPAPDSMFAGQKFWEKRQSNEFDGPLRKSLISLGDMPSGGQTSPILESIYKISLRSFEGRYAPIQPKDAGGSRDIQTVYGGRLIVVSDFMQNTKLLNFYTGNVPKYTAWRETVDGRKWVASHAKIDAQAVIIPREKPNQLSLPGRDFFHAYFASNYRCVRMSDLVTAAKGDTKSDGQCAAGKGTN